MSDLGQMRQTLDGVGTRSLGSAGTPEGSSDRLFSAAGKAPIVVSSAIALSDLLSACQRRELANSTLMHTERIGRAYIGRVRGPARLQGGQ